MLLCFLCNPSAYLLAWVVGIVSSRYSLNEILEAVKNGSMVYSYHFGMYISDLILKGIAYLGAWFLVFSVESASVATKSPGVWMFDPRVATLPAKQGRHSTNTTLVNSVDYIGENVKFNVNLMEENLY